MARKIKTINDELKVAATRLQELQVLKEQQETEEKFIIESTEAQIKSLCEANDLFCGVVVTLPDLLAIIKMAIETKETIKIPFRLYFKDN